MSKNYTGILREANREVKFAVLVTWFGIRRFSKSKFAVPARFQLSLQTPKWRSLETRKCRVIFDGNLIFGLDLIRLRGFAGVSFPPPLRVIVTNGYKLQKCIAFSGGRRK